MENRYPGKDKCDKLREIRKLIADVNEIDFQPAECHHIGPCLGTCPLCDAEIKYLDGELQKKKSRGEKVFLTGLAIDGAEKSGCVAEHGINADKEMIENGFDDIMGDEIGLIEKEEDGEEGSNGVDGEEVMGNMRPFDDWNDWGGIF